MMKTQTRRYDIDWIRDVTVLSIIFYHSLIIFFTRESAIMYVRSGYNLDFCIYMEAILSRITMPMLFLLAGFSVKYSLKKRSSKEFFKNRIKKLLVPLVVCSLTLNPVVTYIYGMSQGRTIGFFDHYIKFITSISEDFNGLTTGYGPMHLWFILYLFVFSVVCLPLFKKCNWKEKKSFVSKRGVLLLGIIPYILIFIVEIMDEMNPIAYLYLFLFGYYILSREEVRTVLKRDRFIYGILAIVMIAGSLIDWFFYTGERPMALQILFLICNKGSRMVAPFAIMAFCDREAINKKSKVLAYFNQANFPIYLYHMFVLTVVGTLVLKISAGPWVKFVLINVISYGVAFGIFECYRRIKYKFSV